MCESHSVLCRYCKCLVIVDGQVDVASGLRGSAVCRYLLVVVATIQRLSSISPMAHIVLL